MAKLNQIIALLKSAKSSGHATLTQAHRSLQSEKTFTGLSRKYTPDANEEYVPDESTLLQNTVDTLIETVMPAYSRIFNLEIAKDLSNAHARADLVVDGVTLVEDVPATFLLTLEKHLVDFRTLVTKLPVLDPTETWTFDSNNGYYVSGVSKTTRTKKLPHAFVKYDATPEHPAQVDMYFEDQVVGTWALTKFSGALPVTTKRRYLQRLDALVEGVTRAREEANGSSAVVRDTVGPTIMDYLFGSSVTS